MDTPVYHGVSEHCKETRFGNPCAVTRIDCGLIYALKPRHPRQLTLSVIPGSGGCTQHILDWEFPPQGSTP